MVKHAWLAALALTVMAPWSTAADFSFYGRSGDAIELNFASLPGVPAGSTFSALDTSGFTGHSVLTSDPLLGQAFSSSGRLWVAPNPAYNSTALGDVNPSARGFQGTLTGSVRVSGVLRSFSVTVQPGYTGSGPGSLNYNYEELGGSFNRPLNVAQQQQRLRYLGFVSEGGDALEVDGLFGPRTDTAFRTFQGVYIGGYNTDQSDADGIVGPNATAWLNAANAPMWIELVDPDPQVPGTWSTSTMIGDFDILPGVDSDGERTGYTRNQERFGSSWSMDLIKEGSARARSYTGRTQRINAISRYDGYDSSCCHSTHRVGMDIDLGTVSSTWNWGDGIISFEEAKVAQHVYGFFSADAQGRVIRVMSSNHDIEDAINNLDSSINVFHDSSGGHQNHIHIDVGAPSRQSGVANLSGDFNLDDVVDGKDYLLWLQGVGMTYKYSDINMWRTNFGRTSATAAASVVPEPRAETFAFVAALMTLGGLCRRPSAARR